MTAARYGAGVTRTGINTANSAYWNLDCTATSTRLFVVQVVVNIAIAPTTAPALYLSRATARGTQASTLIGQQFDESDGTAVGTLDVCGTAGNAPTFSTTNIMGSGGLAVTAGGAWVWSFYDFPLVVDNVVGNGLVVANANASGGTTGTWFCSFIWDE